MQEARKFLIRSRLVATAVVFLVLLPGCQAVRGLAPAVENGSGGQGATQPGGGSLGAAAQPAQTRLPSPAPGTPTPVPSPTLALLSGSPSVGDPFTPDLGNTGYDVQHYDLRLAVDPGQSTIAGTATLQALTTMPNLRQISLDFAGLLVEGTPFEIAVTYSGTPLQEDSPYIHYADYLGLIFPGGNTFYTLSEPDGARYWFPNNDHPLDRATYHIELTVPRGLAAVSNGQLVDSMLSTMPDGSDGATFVWEHGEPLASYLVLAAGGHYLRVDDASPDGIPLVYYYFPELEEDYLDAVDVTGEAIDWMSDLLGPYPYDSYGQATYYALGISMEMQTMTLLSFQMLDERTVVHEMSHSWFGNYVALDNWGDTWRNEGIATYMEVLWLARDDPAEIEPLIAEIEKEVAERGQDYPLDQPPRERILSFDSYNRGALMVHALHQELGDDAFFQGLRTYLARNGGQSVGDDAFTMAMEEAAGRDLDAFWVQWLSQPPQP
jgi:aminopeptidase N